MKNYLHNFMLATTDFLKIVICKSTKLVKYLINIRTLTTELNKITFV